MAKVGKIMAANVPRLKKDAKVEDAAKLLVATEAGCVLIMENKTPVGIITELDIVRNFEPGAKVLNERVGSIMSYPLVFMSPDMKLEEAIKIIDTKGYKKYPVIEKGELVGLVHKKEVIHAISDNLKLHRSIQNWVLLIFILFEIFVFVFSNYPVAGA